MRKARPRKSRRDGGQNTDAGNDIALTAESAFAAQEAASAEREAASKAP
jgi:hypothetical protein